MNSHENYLLNKLRKLKQDSVFQLEPIIFQKFQRKFSKYEKLEFKVELSVDIVREQLKKLLNFYMEYLS